MNNQTLTEIKNRKLEPCYFCLYCLPTDFYLNEGNEIVNKHEIYVFIACNIFGVRKYITSINVNDYTKTSDWYDLFQSFKSNGLETILYALLPKNNALKDALRLSFTNIEFIFSFIQLINKIGNYFTLKYSFHLDEQIKNIYIAKDLNEFKIKKEEFIDTYKENQFILDLLNNYFVNASKTFNYNYLLRKNIYAFYFIRELYKKFNVIKHKKNNFTSIDDFISYLLPSIQLFEKRMYSTKKEWLDLINLIYSSKKDLLINYL